MKDKKVTLHIRISKELLDNLTLKYNLDREAHLQNYTFSEYIRKILRVHCTR